MIHKQNKMKNFLSKIKLYITAHKTMSVIVLIIIVIFGYWLHGQLTSTTGEIKYTLAAVTKGTVISSVSGSGQVSTSSQLNLTPTVSGTITYINVKAGDQVSAGQALFSLDDTDAIKAVRDAKVNLESSQLALSKLQIQDSNQNVSADLAKAYDDGFNTVSSTFLDLVPTLNGINTILNEANLSDNSARNSGDTALNYRNQTETLYYQAQDALNANQADFRLLNRNSSESDIENILNETYATTKVLADTLKSVKNFVDYLAQDTGRSSDFSSAQNTITGYTNTINTDLSNLLTDETNIQNDKDLSPSNNLDLQTAQLDVKQKENALSDAEENLSYYHITAPFDGIIASVPVEVGDDASSGTVLGTIITSQKLATIVLNEVDVAKIKLGQKATLTFDAVPDLTIAGQVSEIDSIGTVSQGVVDYNVQISFSTQDDRVKSGMSADATIITDMAQDVVVVPNGAIKTANNGTSYVQAFDSSIPGAVVGTQGFTTVLIPKQIQVGTGLANDTSTEITSGLNVGDIIVIKSVAGTAAKTTTPSILNAVAGGGGGARRPGGL